MLTMYWDGTLFLLDMEGMFMNKQTWFLFPFNLQSVEKEE